MTDRHKTKEAVDTEKRIGLGAGAGVAVGAVLGVLFENPGLWIAVCLAVGAGIGASIGGKPSAGNNEPDSE